MIDPYNNPYWIESFFGEEIAEAETAAAIKDAARHLIETGEYDPPLTLHSRLTGRTSQAYIDDKDPAGRVTFEGMQGDGGFR